MELEEKSLNQTNEIKKLNTLDTTSPDSTLHKIIKVMNASVNLNWVQVLNLFDVRNPKSDHFFKFLKDDPISSILLITEKFKRRSIKLGKY